MSAGDEISEVAVAKIRRRVRLTIAGLLVLLGLTLVVWWYAVGVHMPLPGFALSAEAVEDLLASWGAWSVAASIVLMVLHSFIPFPAEFIAIANGMLFGTLWGTTITWFGAMLGACLAFSLARWLGRPFVFALVDPRHRGTIDRWAAQQGAAALLFSRFIPVISFNLINYAAGLTAISWWTFLWATGVGILPLSIVMVVMGDRIAAGDVGIWLWLVSAGVVGWLIWHFASAHRRRRSAAIGATDSRPGTPPRL